MRILISWIFGVLASLFIPLIIYSIGKNLCVGAACAQAEFIFVWVPVILIHTTLTMTLYYILKKYKKVKPSRSVFTPAFAVSLPLNCIFLAVVIVNPSNWHLLFGMGLLFGVCYLQSFVCDFYDRRQKNITENH